MSISLLSTNQIRALSTTTVQQLSPGETLQEVYTYRLTEDWSLDSGIGYTRTEQLRLPAKIEGQYRVRVVTNSAAQLYEHGAAQSNNSRTSDNLSNISLNARPDLRAGVPIVPTEAVVVVLSVSVPTLPVATWNTRILFI